MVDVVCVEQPQASWEERSMKHYAGLDVSVKETSICIVDEAGRVCREMKVVSHPEDLLAVLCSEFRWPAVRCREPSAHFHQSWRALFRFPQAYFARSSFRCRQWEWQGDEIHAVVEAKGSASHPVRLATNRLRSGAALWRGLDGAGARVEGRRIICAAYGGDRLTNLINRPDEVAQRGWRRRRNLSPALISAADRASSERSFG